MSIDRDFKGVWIPREIWLNKELSALDKFIFAEIDSLDYGDGCFASNEYLSDFCQCGVTKVSTAISKLKKIGYIEEKSFDGRKRILKIRLSKNERQDSGKCKAEIQEVKEINISENNSREIKSIIKETYKESDKLAQEVIDFFNEHRGEMPKVQRITPQRRSALRARLQDGTLDEIKQVILLAERSAFLQGKKAQWQATFDWLMKPSNFVKVLEGNYNKDECEKPHEKSETDKAIDAIFGGGE